MTEPGPAPVRVVRITWLSALLAVSVVLCFLMLRGGFVGAHRILGWTAASVAVALFLEPIIDFFDRFVPRAISVILTFLILGGIIGGIVVGAVTDLEREMGRLQREAPKAIADLEARDDEVGRLATDLDLAARSETFLEALDERVSGEGALAENASSVPVYFICMILTIFLLVYGPGMAAGAARQLDDRRRRVVVAVLHEATHQARRTVGALLVQGVLIGALTGGVALLLDLPAPVLLGLVAGAAGMIPDVGILLGSLPTVATAAAFGTSRAAIVLLAAAFVLQMIEALYVRPKLHQYGVPIGPAVVWIVAIIGYTIYGPGMAFYGVAYAIFALAVVDQIPRARAELEDST